MFPDKPVNYLPGLYPAPSNHRMKLPRPRPSVFSGGGAQPCHGQLVRARLGLQLLRGLWLARTW